MLVPPHRLLGQTPGSDQIAVSAPFAARVRPVWGRTDRQRHVHAGAAQQVGALRPRVAAALALTSAVVSIAPARPADPGSAEEHEEHEGRAPTARASARGRGRFPGGELRPRQRRLARALQPLSGDHLQILHVGPERVVTRGNNEFGASRSRRRAIGSANGRARCRSPHRRRPSGLYAARLTASDGRVGFAPFVVRPRRLREHRVAVVLPICTGVQPP